LILTTRAFESILWELLENAKKFHPSHDPTIEIELTPLAPAQALLRVVDNGVTLTPEQIDKVWLPYYQAEKYFTGEVPGMGLGLTMVAALIWEVGGSCRLRNRTDGVGTIVELVIPLD
jgi:K+-sensing histidine kinase KdpD